jgi:prepilin-type N-terminal cleavage/methylation domain-containing protein
MTLIELLVVLLIVGVLANIALPAMTIMVRKADATHVIGDFKAVRVAVFDYYATTSAYPASTNWGEMPAALRNELPQGFTFDYKGVQYRWQRFTLPDGMPSDPSQTSCWASTSRRPTPGCCRPSRTCIAVRWPSAPLRV